MKNSIFTLIILIAVFTMSCNENRIYEKHRGGFGNYRWEKEKSVIFEPEISDVEQQYNIYFALRHVYGFQLKSIKINVETTSPSNKFIKKQYEVQVFKNNSEYLSECAGDYCDLESLIEKDFKFDEAGTYKFVITYDMPTKYLPNVMEVGLIIDKNTAK